MQGLRKFGLCGPSDLFSHAQPAAAQKSLNPHKTQNLACLCNLGEGKGLEGRLQCQILCDLRGSSQEVTQMAPGRHCFVLEAQEGAQRRRIVRQWDGYVDRAMGPLWPSAPRRHNSGSSNAQPQRKGGQGLKKRDCAKTGAPARPERTENGLSKVGGSFFGTSFFRAGDFRGLALCL